MTTRKQYLLPKNTIQRIVYNDVWLLIEFLFMKNKINVPIYIFNISRNVRTIFVKKFTVFCAQLVRLHRYHV